MDHLDHLEHRSVHILREAYANLTPLAMLWSIGKDSTVLLWLARRAFFGHVPFPLIHIDTTYKIPEMIEYRDRLAREWRLTLIVSSNDEALKAGKSFPLGTVDRTTCCSLLKTQALRQVLDGTGRRYRLNLETGAYDEDPERNRFAGVIAGVRADEEGSRSKERYFSARDKDSQWEVALQPPEFWDQYKTDFAPGTHVRVHPLLDWREVDVWEYIRREQIPTVSLYYERGSGTRYRSLGCQPCTVPITSDARTVAEIVSELRGGALAGIAERSGRAQDKDGGGSLETLRRDGYM